VDEIPEVVHGLPELTKYWLVVNNHTPQGTLYQHVTPHDQSGLTSEGWDRMYYRGYGLVTSIDYWFLPQVQDYLTTIMRLGRDIEGRWQEQAVMNMMRLVFIPEEKFKQLTVVEIGKGLRKLVRARRLCVVERDWSAAFLLVRGVWSLCFHSRAITRCVIVLSCR
jgi:hypothetical protein